MIRIRRNRPWGQRMWRISFWVRKSIAMVYTGRNIECMAKNLNGHTLTETIKINIAGADA
jgi:hypothetical protein